MSVEKKTVEVGFNAEVRQAIALFQQAKEAEKVAKAQKAEAERVLREALGDAQVATVGGVKAYSLVNGSNRHADLAKLEAEFAEAYEATVKTTAYDYIKA
jgi:hypothetical protein